MASRVEHLRKKLGGSSVHSRIQSFTGCPGWMVDNKLVSELKVSIE